MPSLASIRLLEDLGLSHAYGTFFERHCIFQKNVTRKVNDASSTIYCSTLPFVPLLCGCHTAEEKCKHRVVLDDTAGGWPFV